VTYLFTPAAVAHPDANPRMMVLGYDFVTLDDTEKSQRRLLLNHYAFVAQSSALIIPALCLFRLLFSKATRNSLDNERPRSPSFNKQLVGKETWSSKARQRRDRSVWWMKRDVAPDWGTRGQWVGAGIWMTWLLYLCVVNTGNGRAL
jgi:hypothetical protein